MSFHVLVRIIMLLGIPQWKENITLHANLAIKFWGDRIFGATYLINKMPIEILDLTTPHKDKFDNKGIKLIQALRQWNQELTKFLVQLGYEESKHNYSLFVKVKGDSFTSDLVYVDNVLITCNSSSNIHYLKKSLDDKFTIKDLGLAKCFLGIEICNTANETYLHQMKYTLDSLTDVGLTTSKPNSSPLHTNLKLSFKKGVPLS
ncbi:retrovirus-related pol polyprotein from transposon TNT 1-94 [Tanacetum coccineum]